jgi:hypothetical protein
MSTDMDPSHCSGSKTDLTYTVIVFAYLFGMFRMVVKPGAQYCGEHTPLPVTEYELGKTFQTSSLFLLLLFVDRYTVHKILDN